jgi:hypothetical protein
MRGPLERFGGFDRNAMQFWHELASEMSKEWFTANKQRYEQIWVEPMLALLRDVARGLGPAYRPFKLAEPGVLRIYRDLRFSRDKAPYKTHIAGLIRLAGGRIAEAGHAALYLHLGLDEEYAGAGCYQFDATRTARWRRAVVGPPGQALLPAPDGLPAGWLRKLRACPPGLRPRPPTSRVAQVQGAHLQVPDDARPPPVPAGDGPLAIGSCEGHRPAGGLVASPPGLVAPEHSARGRRIKAQLFDRSAASSHSPIVAEIPLEEFRGRPRSRTLGYGSFRRSCHTFVTSTSPGRHRD